MTTRQIVGIFAVVAICVVAAWPKSERWRRIVGVSAMLFGAAVCAATSTPRWLVVIYGFAAGAELIGFSRWRTGNLMQGAIDSLRRQRDEARKEARQIESERARWEQLAQDAIAEVERLAPIVDWAARAKLLLAEAQRRDAERRCGVCGVSVVTARSAEKPS